MNPAKGHITGQVYNNFPADENTYRFDTARDLPPSCQRGFLI